MQTTQRYAMKKAMSTRQHTAQFLYFVAVLKHGSLPNIIVVRLKTPCCGGNTLKRNILFITIVRIFLKWILIAIILFMFVFFFLLLLLFRCLDLFSWFDKCKFFYRFFLIFCLIALDFWISSNPSDEKFLTLSTITLLQIIFTKYGPNSWLSK